MADLSRFITSCTDALQAEKTGQVVSPARGADGQPLATMAARALRQQEAAPQQQDAASWQLLQQVSQLQQQVKQLQQQPAAPEQPSLSAKALKEEIIAAVSSATQQPAEDPNALQMQLSSGTVDQPQTMADKVLAASVAQAKAEAKVQPLLTIPKVLLLYLLAYYASITLVAFSFPSLSYLSPDNQPCGSWKS